MIAKLLVTLLKITSGLITGVLAIVPDGFHSLVASSSNLNGLAAISLARRPVDEKRPFGLQSFKTLGVFLLAMLILNLRNLAEGRGLDHLISCPYLTRE